MVGVVHDCGFNLVGSDIGLLALLKKKNPDLFDLNDPCHSFNLVVNNSLGKLSPDIKSFVIQIHNLRNSIVGNFNFSDHRKFVRQKIG